MKSPTNMRSARPARGALADFGPSPCTNLARATPDTRSLCLGGSGYGGPDWYAGDLAPLRALSSLRALHVYRATWTDEDLHHVGALRGLRVLSLAGYADTGHDRCDLSRLGALKKLEVLHVRTVAFCAAEPLAGFTSLRSLDLQFASHAQTEMGMFPGGSDLRPIGALRALEVLRLSDRTGFDVFELRRLGRLRRLRDLSLACVEASAVVDLAPLRYLTSLRTVDVSVTRAHSLEPLGNLPLRFASFPATVSTSERRAFAARCPACDTCYPVERP